MKNKKLNLHQLRQLVRKLKFYLNLKSEKYFSKIATLKLQIKNALTYLRFRLTRRNLKRLLGTTIVAFGISLPQTSLAQVATFNSVVQNPFNLSQVYSLNVVTNADLDNDGDQDLLTLDYYGNINYFQNNGTATIPNFASAQQNPFGIPPPVSGDYGYGKITLADLDNDGDLDILSSIAHYDYYSTYITNKLYYYKNIGTVTTPIFASPVPSPFNIQSTGLITFPELVDMDGDGDYDLLMNEINYSYPNATSDIRYYKNIGTKTLANFDIPVIAAFGITLPSGNYLCPPEAADFDNDGDMDLFFGAEDGNIYYSENIGSASFANFSTPINNPFNLSSVGYNSNVDVLDLDGDGDLDLLCGEYSGNFMFFENLNLGPAAIQNIANNGLHIYPNPAQNKIKLEGITDVISKLQILDVNGKIIKTELLKDNSIDISNFSQGQYFITIEFKNKNTSILRFSKVE